MSWQRAPSKPFKASRVVMVSRSWWRKQRQKSRFEYSHNDFRPPNFWFFSFAYHDQLQLNLWHLKDSDQSIPTPILFNVKAGQGQVLSLGPLCLDHVVHMAAYNILTCTMWVTSMGLTVTNHSLNYLAQLNFTLLYKSGKWHGTRKSVGSPIQAVRNAHWP